MLESHVRALKFQLATSIFIETSARVRDKNKRGEFHWKIKRENFIAAVGK